MWGMVPYREKTAVSSMNKVEGRVVKPCPGRNVVDLEVDLYRRGPCGDRNYIWIFEHGRMADCVGAPPTYVKPIEFDVREFFCHFYYPVKIASVTEPTERRCKESPYHLPVPVQRSRTLIWHCGGR